MMIRYIKIDPKKNTLLEFKKFPGLRASPGWASGRGTCGATVRTGTPSGVLLHTLTCERIPEHKGCHANYARPYEVLAWDDGGAARREFEYQLTGKFTEKI